MTKKIPTYSICNLLGADRCMNEIVVVRISDFVKKHTGCWIFRTATIFTRLHFLRKAAAAMALTFRL